MTVNDPVRLLDMDVARTKKIAHLNDEFRAGRSEGRLVVTPGVIRQSLGTPDSILAAVRSFDAFTDANDPHGEHDFGAVELRGEKVFWKIDYYDVDLLAASPDPTCAAVTTRVLTIMCASEY